MKIENKELTDKHIGTWVKYVPDNKNGKTEDGFITSFNDTYVFVRFSGSTSQACRPVNLRW